MRHASFEPASLVWESVSPVQRSSGTRDTHSSTLPPYDNTQRCASISRRRICGVATLTCRFDGAAVSKGGDTNGGWHRVIRRIPKFPVHRRTSQETPRSRPRAWLRQSLPRDSETRRRCAHSFDAPIAPCNHHLPPARPCDWREIDSARTRLTHARGDIAPCDQPRG